MNKTRNCSQIDVDNLCDLYNIGDRKNNKNKNNEIWNFNDLFEYENEMKHNNNDRRSTYEKIKSTEYINKKNSKKNNNSSNYLCELSEKKRSNFDIDENRTHRLVSFSETCSDVESYPMSWNESHIRGYSESSVEYMNKENDKEGINLKNEKHYFDSENEEIKNKCEDILSDEYIRDNKIKKKLNKKKGKRRDENYYSQKNVKEYGEKNNKSVTSIYEGSNDDSENDQLKYYRCRYCEIDYIDSVVQCNTCERWFCNGSYGTCGSHIVTHLVRSKHKEIKLHKNSILGETILECYNCGCRNVFLLGFLPTLEEGVVIIICRDPCLGYYISINNKNGKNGKNDKNDKKMMKKEISSQDEESEGESKIKECNLEKWQPVIEDRCFLEWLVNIPRKEDAEKKGKLTTSVNVNKLEEFWKNKKDVYINELDLKILDDEPKKVKLKYTDAIDYKLTFSPLIELESNYDKSIKEGHKQTNVRIRWDVGLNKKRYAHFVYIKEESELRIVIGDELKISYVYPNGDIWSCEGHISRLNTNEEIALELKVLYNIDGPWNYNINTGFVVEFVWKSTAYDRMQLALNEFAFNSFSLSGYLYHKLLGHDIIDEPIDYNKKELSLNNDNKRYNYNKKTNDNLSTYKIVNYSAPNLAPLNHSQIDAIQKSLNSPLSLIQGPPGTGKTLTCATLVYHMHKTKMGGKVLVTAPSNVAVDQLSVRIHRTGLKVVRLCARSRESVSSIADYLYLHNQVKLLKTNIGEELNKLLELKEEVGELSQKDENRLKKLILHAEYKILIEADVICTTCVGAMDKRLKKFRFNQVLVDEATQSTEPECLVPLVTGAKQIVLVGDHCQLGPIIVCKKAASSGLGKSLFERLMMLGITPFRLEVQYRMHPCLSEFPSYVFYDGCLQNGITLKEREYPLKNFPWPNSKYPMFFYNSNGLEEMSASGTSYLNRNEAQNMEILVRALLNSGLKATQIGVITPYEGQRAYITSLFQKNISYQHCLDIEVASVDAFQGREKDFILLSCVRSNKKLGIGFLNDPRRLNVALTRAKYGLIICGNAKVLSRHHFISKEKINSNETITNVNSVWINLLNQFKKKNLIVEGCLSNLKPITINIPTPVKQPSKYINFDYFHDLKNISSKLYDKEINRYTRGDGNSKGNYKFRYQRNNSLLSQNMSNSSICNESVIDQDIYNFINERKRKNKYSLNSYISNLSQLSQSNGSIYDDILNLNGINSSESIEDGDFNHISWNFNENKIDNKISSKNEDIFPYLFYQNNDINRQNKNIH
ncbi:regulator of nonsense transcripts, putative [Plasmodium berghei]|uniref:Regulator of nonsense transcripts 1, putative n=2 Tax=Plasmodium berghei TaxID=5821 RepID=A0A509AQ05_PLABA|nr:regulator of nonsense transcripts 1, putative [Plasmodium berghei ANKA]CXI73091.1 regulator of nonsense transcripts, putative [Plasmodium berghei]SCM24499.1 regulator of nonsense transcripts, putative [Plasmodium berghei]SCN27081.1 regulator of nonsense transcripts, putative [Plasmodium berghei]SCO61572.1 regulator of nonsense transcripts, putative [Plasmodium berghei]SCO63503.1 regulator of nonsense transcripts, putative [Plasmodium berghei]|eukprot:XP_034422715.1 regulator of nonsense transcripts 1, putative [Plasmodium berghei ANKA]